ncbi:MAG: hypothetical protein QME60_01165 [Verrucomicrobiota bacterium]|nr:hypothetical protein [Verrucomicrobiota bacterium]
MPGLLTDFKKDDPIDERPQARSLTVRGARYVNAAAKFWPSLIDEIREDWPACSLIELTAPSACHLNREHLHPELALQQGFEELRDADMADVMRECLAEMELLGPPSPVRARLFNGQEEMLVRDLPMDSVDSETFSCLVAWHLEWARVPAAQWNSRAVSGTIRAEDQERDRIYHMTFSLLNRRLSEGLFRRSLSIAPTVKPLCGERRPVEDGVAGAVGRQNAAHEERL